MSGSLPRRTTAIGPFSTRYHGPYRAERILLRPRLREVLQVVRDGRALSASERKGKQHGTSSSSLFRCDMQRPQFHTCSQKVQCLTTVADARDTTARERVRRLTTRPKTVPHRAKCILQHSSPP